MHRKFMHFAILSMVLLQVAPAGAEERLSVSTVRAHDEALWYGGHWYHGWYVGRPGWWWVVGRSYYYYSSPAYPYPQVFDPGPATVTAIPDLPTPAPAAYWNFCADPVGYYPYVQTCASRWIRTVPTAVPLAPPPPVPWPG